MVEESLLVGIHQANFELFKKIYIFTALNSIQNNNVLQYHLTTFQHFCNVPLAYPRYFVILNDIVLVSGEELKANAP